MITFPDCFGHSDAIFLFRGSGQNKWCQMTYAIYGVITRVQQFSRDATNTTTSVWRSL